MLPLDRFPSSIESDSLSDAASYQHFHPCQRFLCDVNASTSSLSADTTKQRRRHRHQCNLPGSRFKAADIRNAVEIAIVAIDAGEIGASNVFDRQTVLEVEVRVFPEVESSQHGSLMVDPESKIGEDGSQG